MYQGFFDPLVDWLAVNIAPILISIFSVLVGYLVYLGIKKQIRRLAGKHRVLESSAGSILKIVKILVILIVLGAILSQFAGSFGLITGLFSLMGGTIIGFAAMNTLGNAIAGLIVMTSRPFSVGDRILYNDTLLDVESIHFVYTKMRNLDGVEISIPNQKMLEHEIINFGKKKTTRRGVTVTPGFENRPEDVEKVLLKAASKVPWVLPEPKPYVWITKFHDYAVEYSLFVFINEVKQLPLIDSDLHWAVLKECQDNNLDISTPLLLKKVNGKD